MSAFVWFGIGLCLLHSAIFSGLNLAVFGLARLQLEVEADGGNLDARRLLRLRTDSNFLLTTILWGNVAVNTLLTLLSESVLAGVGAFLFSTIGITFLGEILPQAYFSRNALKMAAKLTPILRFYQRLLYPVAKPSALLLDAWLGSEGVVYHREQFLREMIEKHMQSDEADLEVQEGRGILNFLHLDDLPVKAEGEVVDPASVIALDATLDLPMIPPFERSSEDPFVRKVLASELKWVILTSLEDVPLLVLDADAFARGVLLSEDAYDPYADCHRPVVVTDHDQPVGEVIRRLWVDAKHADDDVIDRDIVIVWTADERRVITGADLLGRLLHGIVPRRDIAPTEGAPPPADRSASPDDATSA